MTSPLFLFGNLLQNIIPCSKLKKNISDYNGFWGDDNFLKLLYHIPVTLLYSALFVSGIHHIYFKKQNACFLVCYIKAL
jgi:hypothetical protein